MIDPEGHLRSCPSPSQEERVDEDERFLAKSAAFFDLDAMNFDLLVLLIGLHDLISLDTFPS